MSKKTPQERIAILERRRDHLAARLRERKGDSGASHDRAELATLNWTLRVLANAQAAGILADLAVGAPSLFAEPSP